MRSIEPFEEFARLGRGVPFLQTSWHSRNAKTGRVDWHEGTLWDYSEFHAALEAIAWMRRSGIFGSATGAGAVGRAEFAEGLKVSI